MLEGKKGYIYKIINDFNDKVYVGQTINIEKRWWKHVSVARCKKEYKSYLYNAMNKHGIEHFSYEVIEICDAESMDEREAYWIKELNSLVPHGYNMTTGGRYLFGKNNPFYGKSHSDETKKKISAQNTNRKVSLEERKMRSVINSGKRNPFYGKTHSEETIKKIVASHTASGHYKRTSERMKKNNPNSGGIYNKKRPVKMINRTTNQVIMEFKSLTEAGNYVKGLGLTKAKFPSNQIKDVCVHRQKTAFGYKWEYN